MLSRTSYVTTYCTVYVRQGGVAARRIAAGWEAERGGVLRGEREGLKMEAWASDAPSCKADVGKGGGGR